MNALLKFVKKNAVYLAWLISLVGFCMSVFYGEILGNPPCPLCWYQRIALFPIVILLGMAAYRGESAIIPYVLPIAFLGGFIALIHILQPHVPFIQRAGICKIGMSCAHSGFTAIFPFLSAIGFFIIALLLFYERKRKH